MNVMIVGAGIGGLATALMLHARGLRPMIFEAAREVRPLGVGINVQPSAIAELALLGLLDRLADTGIETAELVYANRHGQRIWAEPRGRGAGYAVPQFSIHRGELQMLLYQAVVERLGRGALALGIEAVHADPDTGRVRLRDRDTGTESVEQADAVIAADGIHSAIRRQFAPHEGLPRYSGRVLWRATSEGAPFLGGRTMVQAGHADQKFVVYPISKRAHDAGRSLINWIAELKLGGDTPPKDDWNREVDRAVFAAQFAQWRWPWLDVPALIDSAEQVFEFPMVDRDPLPRWSHGRVTLLGDAAHPMYPIGSNGASQAILDARMAADALAQARDAGGGEAAVVDALSRYDAQRRPATAALVMANRGQGPDQVLQIAEERAPGGFDDIERVIPRRELEEIAARYKRLAGMDVETVNAKLRREA